LRACTPSGSVVGAGEGFFGTAGDKGLRVAAIEDSLGRGLRRSDGKGCLLQIRC